MRPRRGRPHVDVNSRTLEAIAACTRTLGEASDADTALFESDEVTIGPLRARADRLALRSRFHDDAAHAACRPSDPPAASLYESLSAARLDAIGVGWLPGVAHNLLAFPGVDHDGLRWLAFEQFAGR